MQEFRWARGPGADDTQLAGAVLCAYRIANLVYTRVPMCGSDRLLCDECHGSVYRHLVGHLSHILL